MAKATPFKNRSGKITWRVQYRVDGKGKQETFLTETEASRFANSVNRVGGAAAREQLTKRAGKTVTAPTLSEWVDKYLDPASGILTGIQPGTRDGYRRMADNAILPRLGDLPIDEITRDDVGAWVVWVEGRPSPVRKGETIAAKTVRNYHAFLSNVFSAAVDRHLMQENPAHRTRLSEGLAREAVFLSVDEFYRLLEAIPVQHKGLVYFLAGTGMRWSEATALRWSDINLDTMPPTVRVTRAWKKNPGGTPEASSPKTRAGRRTIAITTAILARLGEPGEPDQLVFRGRYSGNRVWYGAFRDKVWVPSVARAGLTREPKIHDLRHTHASWLIADGEPLTHVQQRLGHENITTTIAVYSHLMPDAQTRVVASIDRIMRRELSA